MFRKILIFAMVATAAGYCFADEKLQQVVTSEVFYEQETDVDENVQIEQEFVQPEVPAWPLAGTDADVEVGCADGMCSQDKQQDNIRIVSKIGADLVVENNFNVGGVRGDFNGWSGGANMLHGMQVPAGFDNECANNTEMPLLSREMLEDDGGTALSVSRSTRKTCGEYADGYAAFAMRAGIKTTMAADGTIISQGEAAELGKDGLAMFAQLDADEDGTSLLAQIGEEISVDASADAEAPAVIKDQVRSWVVASGQTLREVLQNWANKEGWDLVWATSREYPIEASAVFKGGFVDVASAFVRNFSRATPIPYAKFYKGNRVLVISTSEE